MEALEKYYNECLLSYYRDSNFESYDVDEQMTKDRIEAILEVGFLTKDDIDFVYSILPDIQDDILRFHIEDYVERLMFN